MSDAEASVFLERISATAIVNQAVWKCLLAQITPDRENIMVFVSEFLSTAAPTSVGLAGCIERAIEEVLSAAALFATARGPCQ